jgi:arsenate reductase (thioredoxin)
MAAFPEDPPNTTPMRVLFLCTHNSSRSQMAEGLLRTHGGTHYQVFSAGTHPSKVHPLAIKVMAELGIDISEQAGHQAKGVEEFEAEPPMELVVTVCDEAAEECPYFPRARRQEHWGFPDPSAATGSEEERLEVFRRVRDDIAARIDVFVKQNQESA